MHDVGREARWESSIRFIAVALSTTRWVKTLKFGFLRRGTRASVFNRPHSAQGPATRTTYFRPLCWEVSLGGAVDEAWAEGWDAADPVERE